MIRSLALILGAALLTFTLSAALSSQADAQTDNTWTIDGAHSNVGFKVRHMAVSWTRGSFAKVDGTINFDGKNLNKASVDITIGMDSISTKNKKRDEHLRSADFFDVEKHPTMTFKSTKVKTAKGEMFQLIGDLTIKGVTKQVTLDVEGATTPVNDPWGNVKLGFTATGKIARKDFGITWNKSLDGGGLVVGDDVHLTIDVELNKSK